MNDEEFNKLNKDILKSGLTKESYLRKLVLKNKIIEKPDIDFYKVLNVFNAIGRNLNQLTKKANSGILDVENINQCIAALMELIKETEERLKG